MSTSLWKRSSASPIPFRRQWRAASLAAALVVALAGPAAAGAPGKTTPPGRGNFLAKNYKLDDELTRRAAHGNPDDTTSVVVRLAPGADLPAEFRKFARTDRLDILNAYVLDTAQRAPEAARGQRRHRPCSPQPQHPREQLHDVGHGRRAAPFADALGYTGAGVGVAVIDSGITTWHDDLTAGSRQAVSVRQSAGREVRRLRQRPRAAVRRQRPRHACRRHHRSATATTRSGQKAGIAPDASPRRR